MGPITFMRTGVRFSLVSFLMEILAYGSEKKTLQWPSVLTILLKTFYVNSYLK